MQTPDTQETTTPEPGRRGPRPQTHAHATPQQYTHTHTASQYPPYAPIPTHHSSHRIPSMAIHTHTHPHNTLPHPYTTHPCTKELLLRIRTITKHARTQEKSPTPTPEPSSTYDHPPMYTHPHLQAYPNPREGAANTNRTIPTRQMTPTRSQVMNSTVTNDAPLTHTYTTRKARTRQRETILLRSGDATPTHTLTRQIPHESRNDRALTMHTRQTPKGLKTTPHAETQAVAHPYTPTKQARDGIASHIQTRHPSTQRNGEASGHVHTAVRGSLTQR